MKLMVLILAVVLVVGIFIIYSIARSNDDPAGGNTIAQTTEQTAAPETAAQETTVPETTAAVTETLTVSAPEVTASQVIVADGTTGKVLYEKGGLDTRVYPASVTKLFTAYVALQILDKDQVLTAGLELEMVAPDSSRAWIYEGQQVTTAMAVQGLLLSSGNDAAYILAAAAGWERDPRVSAPEAVAIFVDEMNKTAKSLGLDGTHWTNPDGYHDEEHYTCLEDLVVIAQLAMLNPTIRECVATVSADVRYASGETNTWHNTNSLIDPESPFYEPMACGLKTGHTNAAGYCLLSAFRRDEGYTIIGVFGSSAYDTRFSDTLMLANEFIGTNWEMPVPEDTSADVNAETTE